MPRIRLIVFFLLPLSLFPLFSENGAGGDDVLLSLKQIDVLIDTTAYNEALRQLTKYMAAHPNDFDRAQQRISRIMIERENFNKGAEDLVDLIKNGDESKSEKLTKITELEASELDSTDTVIDFTNLARRTVTLSEVLIHFNRIMREGVALVRDEKFTQAALKFEEGFSIKNESSDLVFDSEHPSKDDLGTLVVYESDITSPVRKSVHEVRSIVAGTLTSKSMDARLDECEISYEEYVSAIKAKNIALIESSIKKVKKSFVELAELRNKIIAESLILDKADELANERNPGLMGTSYISFYQKFILGDEGNPDSGIIGSIEAYFNKRVEDMKSRTNDNLFEILNSVLVNLPEDKIYSLTEKIPLEQRNIASAKSYASFVRDLHNLYYLEKNLDGSTVGEKHSAYSSSIGFVNEYVADLDLVFQSVAELAFEKNNPEKIDGNDVSAPTVSHILKKLLHLEKIKSDSKSYVALIENEQEREKKYFDSKSEKEKALAELIAVSGGKIKISTKKRDTAGVQISDDPLDFRKQISYFTSINGQNFNEASSIAKGLWGYMAQAYANLALKSYQNLEERASDTEFLFLGKKKSDDDDDDFSADFIKRFPIEAKDSALKLNSEIAKKKDEFVSKRKLLEGGEEYRSEEKNYDDGTKSLDGTIAKFDSLTARNVAVIKESEPKIREYEQQLKHADEQYKLALAYFKTEDFDGANAAIEIASGTYAMALDIEFSEKIRVMREVTLNDLAKKIQQAEYAKVLREVFALKDKATTLYYSSNFDGAENILLNAQVLWAKVSTESDPEIEDLLGIIKTVKSATFGRVLLQSDPHYPELSYSLDMAKQNFEKGVKLKKQGNVDEANGSFNLALTNVRNVQNVYPLNQEARFITLKIQQELDPEKFQRDFSSMLSAAKSKSSLSERLAELEALYEINPKYPNLAQDIYNIKDSLGMFPKKTVKKEVKKSADSKIAEAKRAFKAAGSDEEKLKAALALANEAIAIDGTNKAAKELKLDIQLKIGATATAILSQNDEKMYAEAARLFNQRRFNDSKQIMDRLLVGAAAKKSRKVIDLYNRILKRI